METDNPDPDYGFILNPARQSTGNTLPAGNSKKQRILIITIGGSIFLAIFAIVFSLIFSSGSGGEDRSLKLAQTHIELVRIADIGTDKARSTEARNLAATTKLALQSTEASIVGIAQRDRELSEGQLSGGQDSEVDQRLEEATQLNKFDEVFLEIIRGKLLAYKADLEFAHDSSSSERNKETYRNIYSQVSALVPESDDQLNSGVLEPIFATSS